MSTSRTPEEKREMCEKMLDLFDEHFIRKTKGSSDEKSMFHQRDGLERMKGIKQANCHSDLRECNVRAYHIAFQEALSREGLVNMEDSREAKIIQMMGYIDPIYMMMRLEETEPEKEKFYKNGTLSSIRKRALVHERTLQRSHRNEFYPCYFIDKKTVVVDTGSYVWGERASGWEERKRSSSKKRDRHEEHGNGASNNTADNREEKRGGPADPKFWDSPDGRKRIAEDTKRAASLLAKHGLKIHEDKEIIRSPSLCWQCGMFHFGTRTPSKGFWPADLRIPCEHMRKCSTCPNDLLSERKKLIEDLRGELMKGRNYNWRKSGPGDTKETGNAKSTESERGEKDPANQAFTTEGSSGRTNYTEGGNAVTPYPRGSARARPNFLGVGDELCPPWGATEETSDERSRKKRCSAWGSPDSNSKSYGDRARNTASTHRGGWGTPMAGDIGGWGSAKDANSSRGAGWGSRLIRTVPPLEAKQQESGECMGSREDERPCQELPGAWTYPRSRKYVRNKNPETAVWGYQDYPGVRVKVEDHVFVRKDPQSDEPQSYEMWYVELCTPEAITIKNNRKLKDIKFDGVSRTTGVISLATKPCGKDTCKWCWIHRMPEEPKSTEERGEGRSHITWTPEAQDIQVANTVAGEKRRKEIKEIEKIVTRQGMLAPPPLRLFTALTWVSAKFFRNNQFLVAAGLWDSCCNRAFIDEAFFRSLCERKLTYGIQQYMVKPDINGSCGGRQKIWGWTAVYFSLGGPWVWYAFEIVPSLGVPFMIGCRFMELIGSVTDHGTGIIYGRNMQMQLKPGDKVENMPRVNMVKNHNGNVEKVKMCKFYFTEQEALQKSTGHMENHHPPDKPDLIDHEDEQIVAYALATRGDEKI